MKIDQRKFGRPAKYTKTAGIVLTIIAFLGIVGAGLCESIAMRAPGQADFESGLTAALDFKGQPRFVSPGTANCCKATVWVAFGAAAGAVAASAVLFFVFGRLPHE